MSLATKAQIKKALEQPIQKDKYGYDITSGGASQLRNAIINRLRLNRHQVLDGTYKIDDDDIDRFLQAELDELLMHRLGKGVRPWDIINVTEKLDKKQAWIGIEYETGFSNATDYRKIINFVWNNFPNSAVDSEGSNEYPCELTFPPINYDVFMSPKNPMDRLYDFMSAQKIVVDDTWGCGPSRCSCGDPDCDELDYDDYGYSDQVGTHCNISTPAFRALDNGVSGGVVQVMNISLGTLSDTNLQKLFGREPYGGFYHRGNQRDKWIEGKLFNSTGSAATWEKYKDVIGRLAEVIEAVSVALSDPAKEIRKDGKDLTVTNFAGFLSGRSKEIKLGYVSGAKIKNDFSDWW